jgi:hypothetical protein
MMVTFILPPSFDIREFLITPRLLMRGDDVRWLVSAVLRKTANRDTDLWGLVLLDSRILRRIVVRESADIIRALEQGAIEVTPRYTGVKCKGYRLIETRTMNKGRSVHPGFAFRSASEGVCMCGMGYVASMLYPRKRIETMGAGYNSPAVVTLGRSAAVPAQGQRELMSRNSGSSKSGSFPGNERVDDPAATSGASSGPQVTPKTAGIRQVRQPASLMPFLPQIASSSAVVRRYARAPIVRWPRPPTLSRASRSWTNWRRPPVSIRWPSALPV